MDRIALAAVVCVTLSASQVFADSPDVHIIGTGKSRSVQVSGAFGALSESVPLEAPPGRMRPTISLEYGALGGTGPAGKGWSYSLGSITRSFENGAAAIADDDTFVFQLGSASAKLVAAGGGVYRAATESEYRRYEKKGDGWEVRDTEGTIFRFGSTPSTRIEAPGPADGSTWIGEWLVDQIEDRNGNTLSVQYATDQGSFYISKITYGGHTSTGALGASAIEFSYEPRPDVTSTYRLGVRQVHALRLKQVRMAVAGAQARRYTLTYRQSALNAMSLLEKIGLRGSDDASELPVRTYAYAAPATGWSGTDRQGSIPVAFNDSEGTDLGTQLTDIDGDGFADIVRAWNGSFRVLLGDGAGAFAESAAWTTALGGVGLSFTDDKGQDQGVRLMDVDGDGRPDILRARAKPVAHDVFLNTGRGFARSSSYSSSLAAISESASAQLKYIDPAACAPPELPDGGVGAPPPECENIQTFTWRFALVRESGDAPGVQLGDVNGDGRVDIVWSYESTPMLFDLPGPDGVNTTQRVPAVIRAIYINTGAGFARNERLSDAFTRLSTPLTTPFDPANPDHYRLSSFVVDTETQGYSLVDINGDGITDLVRVHGAFPKQVFLGTGVGWRYDLAYSGSLAATRIESVTRGSDGKTLVRGLYAFDYNGDGLLDYVRADPDLRQAWVNTGTGFIPDAAFTAKASAAGLQQVDAEGKPRGQLLADVNGDGGPDVVYARGGDTTSVRLSTLVRPDLLARATTLYGEVTEVTYRSSAEFDNRDASGVHAMPTLLPVVATLTRRDGRGASYGYSYFYRGGVYAGRKMRGFSFSEETDPRGVRNQSYFLQSDDLIGRLDHLDTVDSAGAIRHRTTATYAVVPVASGVRQVRVTATQEETIDPGGTARSRLETTHDAYLRPVEVRKLGDPAVASDDLRIGYEYAENWTRHLIGRPSRIRFYGSDGRTMEETTTLYDGLAFGQVDKGNPTTTTNRFTASVTASATFQYDIYGKLTRSVDRLGGVVTYAYDTVHHDFAERVTDPLGRVTGAQNDPLTGRPLSTTDANGATTTFTYDAFARLASETLPGDECSPLGTRSYAYSALGSAAAQWALVRSTVTPGSPATLDTRVYFDGLLRPYQSEKPGVSGTILARQTFDDADQVVAQVRPRYASEPEAPVQFELDALRRTRRITFPDATSMSVEYRGNTQEVIDPAGNRVAYDFDANKNLIATHEFVGAQEFVSRRALDERGRIVRLTDAAGQVTTITYDMGGRRVGMNDPSTGNTGYVYDAEGRLIRQTDAKGNVIAYTYNAAGQVLTRTMPGRPDLLGRPTTTRATYTYGTNAAAFDVGRLVRVTDESGTVALKYDPRGHVIERRREVNGCFEPRYVIGYGYDSLGRLDRITYPDGYQVRYTFDAAGMVSDVSDADGHVLARMPAYTATGQPRRIEFGNGVTTQHGFDGMEHLATMVTQGPALPLLGTPPPLQDFAYTYDPRGNLATIEDAVRHNDQSFEYDPRGFLSRAVGPYGEERYEYDAIGNMIRKGPLAFHAAAAHNMQTDCAIDLSLGDKPVNGLAWDDTLMACARDLNSASSALGADAKAQLTRLIARATIFSPDIGNSFKVGYDANGSMIGKKRQRYEYDALNRLTVVRDPLGIPLEENQYTESGERVSQVADGKMTVFIDRVYERMATSLASDLVTRHVPVNGRVLASVQSTRIASPLIQSADESDLRTCHSPAGVIGFGLRDAERRVDAWLGSGDGAPPMVMTAERARRIREALAATAGAGMLVCGLLLGLALARRRQIARAWSAGARLGRALLRQSRRSARFARRKPLRSLTAAVAVVSQVLLAGCGGPEGLQRAAGADLQGSAAKLIDITRTAYYHYDHLGNVHVISDDFGTERQRFETKPYGERYDEYRWPTYNSMRTSFNGQSLEPVSGLYHFGARLYDAELGRFLSADPTIPHERRTVALNRYAFNANNPVRFIDTNGYSFWDGLKKALVWIGVAVVAVLSVVLTVVTFGAAGAPMALLLGAVIGAAIGFAVGAIWSAVAGKFDIKVALMFAAAGALAGMSVGGVAVSAGSLATATISLQTSVALMNLGGVVGSVGGIVAGAAAVARNGCESVALMMMVGWAAGSLTGLINGLGGMAFDAGGGVGFALAAAVGALGFGGTPGFFEHVKGVVFGERRIEEMAGKKPEVGPPIPKPSEPPTSPQSPPGGGTISWQQLWCWIQQQLGISPMPLYGFSGTCS